MERKTIEKSWPKYEVGQKIKVLIGCIWTNAEVEKVCENDYYLIGNRKWSTHYHASWLTCA